MYYLYSFGVSRCDEDGTPVALQPTTFLLLVYLLMKPEGVTREVLCRSFWPHAKKSLAKHALSQQLYALRRRLPRLSIIASSTHVRIDPLGITLDARVLLTTPRLPSSLDLRPFKGTFLETIADRLTPELQGWRDDVELELHRALVDHLLAQAEEAERAATWSVAEQLLNHAFELGCRTPDLCARLVAARVGTQQITAAEALHKEATLLHGTAWAEAYPLPRPATPTRVQGEDHSHHRFIGRVREFNWLRERWRAAIAGNAALVVVRGEAGIGKTRLVYQLEKLCALQGGNTLKAQCFEGGRRIAYAPIVQLLKQNTHLAGNDLGDAEASENLFQHTSRAHSDNAPLFHAAAMAHKFVAAVSAQLSQAPLLIVIDNCQWLDQPTADLLGFLRASLANKSLLIVGCARPTSALERTDMLQLLTDDELILCSLSESESLALARSVDMLADEEQLHRISTLSGGNPFFLVELMRQPVSVAPDSAGRLELPSSIQRLVSERFNQLSAVAQRVACTAAVLDSAARPAFITTVGALTQNELLQGTEELVRAGFVTGDRSNALRLKHDLIREGVYRLIDQPTKSLLHSRAARAIHRRRKNPEQVADHAESGGLTKLAWKASIAAGDRAASVGAGSDAVHWYNRAVNLSRGRRSGLVAKDRVLRLAASGRAPQHSAHDYVQDLREWYMSEDSELGLLRCEYIEAYETLLAGHGSLHDRIDRLLAIGARADTLSDGALALEAYKEAIASASYSFTRASLANLLRTTIGSARGSKPHSVPTMAFLAASMVVCGTSDEAVEWAELAVREALVGGLPHDTIRARAARASAYWAAGRLHAALSDFACAVEQSSIVGGVSNLNGILANYALLLSDMARYAEAEQLLTEVAARNRNRGHLVLINRAILAYEAGHAREALPIIGECEVIAARSGTSWLGTVAIALKGLIAWDCGDSDVAESCWRSVRPGLESFLAATSDPIVVAAFAARMMARRDGLQHACSFLRDVSTDVAPRNAVMAAKLRLEIAELQLDTCADRSYALAKDALLFGQSSGATSVSNRASALLEHIQLRAP